MIDINDFATTDDAVQALRLDSGADSQIVAGILNDLTDRGGFDNEWYGLDEDIQLEILGQWLNIVRAVFNRGGAA